MRELRGDAVECNVCGWHGARFADDSWHPGTVCPSCGSQIRHRLLAVCFAQHTQFSASQVLDRQSILHFAPERQLREQISREARRYVSADFDRGDVDLKLDMSSMPGVPDQSFDTVIACDVLEHVPDDAAAMRELFRVLRPGGTAILTAPQKDPPSATDEDPAETDPGERLRRFGQRDHARIYGDDLAARLEAAGFEVAEVEPRAFPPEIVRRFVLEPPVLSKHPLATNRRRIYFCRRRT